MKHVWVVFRQMNRQPSELLAVCESFKVAEKVAAMHVANDIYTDWVHVDGNTWEREDSVVYIDRYEFVTE